MTTQPQNKPFTTTVHKMSINAPVLLDVTEVFRSSSPNTSTPVKSRLESWIKPSVNLESIVLSLESVTSLLVLP